MEWTEQADLRPRHWPSKFKFLAKLMTYAGLVSLVGCAYPPKAGGTAIHYFSGPDAPQPSEKVLLARAEMLDGPLKLRLTSIGVEEFRQLATKLEVNFFECARTTTREDTIRETPEKFRNDHSYLDKRDMIRIRACIFQSKQSSHFRAQSIEESQQQNVDAFVAAYSAYLKCDNVPCISRIAASLQLFSYGRDPYSPLIYAINDSLPSSGYWRNVPYRGWWLPGNGPCSRHNQRIRFYNPMEVNPLEEFVCALMLGVFENGR